MLFWAFTGGLTYLRDSTAIYRAVSTNEAASIKDSGKFSLKPGGFESKQFGTSYNEVRACGKLYRSEYSQIVKTRVHNSVLSQFHFNNNREVGILNKVYTVYSHQMDLQTIHIFG